MPGVFFFGDNMATFGFPIGGIDKGRAVPEEDLAVTHDINNCRGYDVLDKKARGGQRPAFVKRYPQQIGGVAAPIIAICKVTVVN
jgi:hypothetical protein